VRTNELIVVGNACVDLFIPKHTPPPPGGLEYIDPLGVELGGNGANTAITAARLGVSTALAGTFGDDIFANHVRACLVQEGVDLSTLEPLEGVCGPTTVVLNDPESGERSFVHHTGSNAYFRLHESVLERPCEIFHFAAPQLLGNFFPGPCIEFARQLRDAGRRISLDIIETDLEGLDPVEVHRPLLEIAEMIFPNESEARYVSGETDLDAMISYFHDLGIPLVVIKRGADGAIVSWEDQREEIGTREVDAIDTCGAGDNFVAGFLAGQLRGLDPISSARLGCALGTMCVEERGSLAASSDGERVAALLDQFGLQRQA